MGDGRSPHGVAELLVRHRGCVLLLPALEPLKRGRGRLCDVFRLRGGWPRGRCPLVRKGACSRPLITVCIYKIAANVVLDGIGRNARPGVVLPAPGMSHPCAIEMELAPPPAESQCVQPHEQFTCVRIIGASVRPWRHPHPTLSAFFLAPAGWHGRPSHQPFARPSAAAVDAEPSTSDSPDEMDDQ